MLFPPTHGGSNKPEIVGGIIIPILISFREAIYAKNSN